MKRLFTLVLFVLSFQAMAQTGFLRGKIIDETTGEPIFGATVVKQGTTMGAVSDFDGNYSLSLPIGTHTIVFQSVSFRPIVMDGVEVKEGETMIIDVIMKEDVEELEAVVVTAQVAKSTDMGVMLVQKKSVNTLDGISSSTFRKIGDNNLSSAMKRVTGVTVQGGKYVYVRGLGDRYTKTALNGMIVPGLDPDRNDVQIDIFPTGVLENVMVYKTFSPNLTGDFTGGLIDIQTKAFPDEKSTSLSLNFGFNPDMNFNSNYLSYDGSATDVLGFDNGDRDLPVESGSFFGANEAITKSFDPTLAAERNTSFMNTGFSFGHRNQIKGNRLTWGYNALLTYRNNYRLFQDFERNQYERDRTSGEVTLERDYSSKGDLASNEVLLSGLISLAAKTDNTTIGVNLLHIQNGVSSALNRIINQSDLNNPNYLYNDIINFTERSLSNTMLFGKHQFNRLRFEWTNSLIFSRQYEPDYRDTRIGDPDRDGRYGFQNGGQIERFWRDLSEINENFKMDFTYDLNQNNKLKFGGAFNYRDRDFNLIEFEYPRGSTDDLVTSPDANDLLVPEKIYSSDNPIGFFIDEKSSPGNSYEGKQLVYAAYIMNEMQITDKLKSVYGVRLEQVEMKYSGQSTKDDNSGTIITLKDATTLDETNFLPSVNLIYSLTEDINLRGSFNKTLARPSFKEKSEVFIDDPISDLIFLGNVNVKQAEILNYDLRGEYFFKGGQMLSLSFFYKDFTNHIALVPYSNEPGQIAPRNVGEARVYGLEFELRKRMDFISPFFSDFMLGTNVSLVNSRVDRRSVPVHSNGRNEYDSEVEYGGTDEGVDVYRNMSFQAPFSVNAFLSYESEKGISANLAYNVQGETLTYVSAAFVPEVYTRPFNSLNFKISKSIGKDGNSSISLTAKNLLDDENELYYSARASQDKIFTLRRPGRTFSFTYAVNF